MEQCIALVCGWGSEMHVHKGPIYGTRYLSNFVIELTFHAHRGLAKTLFLLCFVLLCTEQRSIQCCAFYLMVLNSPNRIISSVPWFRAPRVNVALGACVYGALHSILPFQYYCVSCWLARRLPSIYVRWFRIANIRMYVVVDNQRDNLVNCRKDAESDQ